MQVFVPSSFSFDNILLIKKVIIIIENKYIQGEDVTSVIKFYYLPYILPWNLSLYSFSFKDCITHSTRQVQKLVMLVKVYFNIFMTEILQTRVWNIS